MARSVRSALPSARPGVASLTTLTAILAVGVLQMPVAAAAPSTKAQGTASGPGTAVSPRCDRPAGSLPGIQVLFPWLKSTPCPAAQGVPTVATQAAQSTQPAVTPAAEGNGPTAATAAGEPLGAPAASTFSTNWTSPWGISFLPDGQSALTTERFTYRVHRLWRNGTKQLVGTVPNTVAGPTKPAGAGGLLGVAPSPTWNGTSDKDVFFVHTTANSTRVVKMHYDGRSLSDYTVILGGIAKGGDHNGGRIAFGPDGYLYVSTGDAHLSSAPQDRNSLNGKILRITKTGAPAPGNPFGNHVYSMGHRNPQGLAWDARGRLWETEIGESTYDELNLIKPGANYGWPTCEGPCNTPGMTNPKKVWAPTVGVPAQLAIVHDVIYVSTLRGQRLWRVPIGSDGQSVGTATSFYNGAYGRLRAIAKVPGADELWLSTNGRGAGRDLILKVTIK